VGLHTAVVLLVVATVCCTVGEGGGSKESTTSSSTQTDPPGPIMSAVDFLSAMPVTSLLRSGAVLVVFLAILFWDRRASTWIQSQVYYMGFTGFCAYFAPSANIHLVGNVGPVHDYLIQVLGCWLLTQSYCLYQLSRDGMTQFVIFLGQAVGGAMLLVIHLYGHFKYQKDDIHFESEHLTLMIPIAFCITVGGVIFLYRHGSTYDGRAEPISLGGINTHLIVDGFVTCLLGLQSLAFPEISLGSLEGVKPDGVMATFVRHLGCLMLVGGFFSIFMCSIPNENDKRIKLLEKIVVTALYLPMATLYQLKIGFMTWPVFVSGIFVAMIPLANAVCALYIRGRKKKRS